MFFQLVLIGLGMLLGLAIAYLVSTGKPRKKERLEEPEFMSALDDDKLFSDISDDIVSIRKCVSEPCIENQCVEENANALDVECSPTSKQAEKEITFPDNLLIIHLLAQPNRQFVGYELLQSLLAVGMRYGEMEIFHRYRDISGQGEVFFSLASANKPGTFDIHNIGGFTCSGLIMFMRCRPQREGNLERFTLMLQAATQLAEDLGGELFDNNREPLTAEMTACYKKALLSMDSFSEACSA